MGFSFSRTLSTFNYSWSTARSDLTAGATVAAIAVPQAIAYALIAGVDPRYGLYSAIIITIVASVLGSSAHLINGPTNAISIAVFSALALVPAGERVQAAILLAMLVGIVGVAYPAYRGAQIVPTEALRHE